MDQELLEDNPSSKEQKSNNLKLDYSIQDISERVQLVNKIIETTPKEKLTNGYLTRLADYLIFNMDKKEKKEKTINTDNRMVTINKRQTSFEGLVSKFENGEDGIYNMIINDKNVLLTPKYQITQQDIDTIPYLKQLRQQIKKVEESAKTARGRKRFLLNKQIIEMRQDQYVIKNAYKPVTYSLNLIKSLHYLDLSDKITIDQQTGKIEDDSLISFFNPSHISILLCNYSKLKESCWDVLNSDLKYMIMDLQDAIDRILKDNYPMYFDILVYKIDGKQNIQIQQLLYDKYQTTHSIEYISSLWRKKIPKILAEQLEKDYLIWYYTNVQRGKWKRCSRCGQIKLAHNKFFSKNNTSKDGWYSICKQCRNKKNKKV